MQTFESREIAIAGAKRQSVLDRHSCQMRIWDQPGSSTEVAQQARLLVQFRPASVA
jgi:hypothetical protein